MDSESQNLLREDDYDREHLDKIRKLLIQCDESILLYQFQPSNKSQFKSMIQKLKELNNETKVFNQMNLKIEESSQEEEIVKATIDSLNSDSFRIIEPKIAIDDIQRDYQQQIEECQELFNCINDEQLVQISQLKFVNVILEQIKEKGSKQEMKRCAKIMFESEKLMLDGNLLRQRNGKELLSHLILKTLLIKSTKSQLHDKLKTLSIQTQASSQNFNEFSKKLIQFSRQMPETFQTLIDQECLESYLEQNIKELLLAQNNIDQPLILEVNDNIKEDPFLIDSVLATELDQRLLIKDWLENKEYSTELLWRGSVNGFSSSSFHTKCDQIAPTIVIIKSTLGKIFGGFTTTPWEQDNNYKTDHNNFTFSLTHRTKHRHYRNHDRSMYCGSTYLVVFGGCDCDFRIVDNCNTSSSSYTNLGFAYEPPPQFEYNTEEAKSYFAGAATFLVEEIELYHLKLE